MSEAAENTPMSFRESKAAELREEWSGRMEAQPTSEERERVTSEAPTQPEDDYEDVVDAEDNATDEDMPTEEAELDEPTESDGADDESGEVDYKSQYEALEKEYRRVTANRKQIEQDRADEAEAFVRMKHDYTDTHAQLVQQAEFYANLPKQQLQQLQQVNPATLQPEQQAQYYQAVNAATQQAQFLEQQLNGIREEGSKRLEAMKQREAELASARLKASIPEWSNEHYRELGNVAANNGFSAEEYLQITDPRIIELLHKEWKASKASEAVKNTVKQRKANPPRSRSANQQPRNSRGQYEKARREARPNQRGSHARAFAERLRMERERR